MYDMFKNENLNFVETLFQMRHFAPLFAIILSLTLQAQSKQVIVRIDHKLGTDTCAEYTTAVNNLGMQFELYRLQYYMDQFIMVHDNGVADTSNVVALVNGFNSTELVLGTFDIDSLEAIRFAIGVNESLNHLDPTTYPANHPLSPKSPSMHWGWTSGYRFICVEGNAGSSLNQTMEFHGLGDTNYAHMTISTEGQISGDTIYIDLVADYQELFRGINVASGPISHGEDGDAARVLHNINNYVFSSAEGNQAMHVEDAELTLTIYPNPSRGTVNLVIDEPAMLEVYSTTGQLYHTETIMPGVSKIDLKEKGIFVFRLITSSKIKEQRVVLQ
jgi:hypothetical protein